MKLLLLNNYRKIKIYGDEDDEVELDIVVVVTPLMVEVDEVDDTMFPTDEVVAPDTVFVFIDELIPPEFEFMIDAILEIEDETAGPMEVTCGP